MCSLAILLHRRPHESVLRWREFVDESLWPGISILVQQKIQAVADLLPGYIIAGVNIEPVPGIAASDLGTEYLHTRRIIAANGLEGEQAPDVTCVSDDRQISRLEIPERFQRGADVLPCQLPAIQTL